MKHLLLMFVFAALVAVPFSFFGKEQGGDKIKYGLKIFFEFIVAGLAISWALFLLP